MDAETIERIKAWLVKRWIESLDESEEAHEKADKMLKNFAFCLNILEDGKR